MSIRTASIYVLLSCFIAASAVAQSSISADVLTDLASGVDVDVKTGDATTSSFRVFNSSNAELLRVTATGNVGIGTATPEAKLHVIGDARFTGGANKAAIFTAATGQDVFMILRSGTDPAALFSGVFFWRGTPPSSARCTVSRATALFFDRGLNAIFPSTLRPQARLLCECRLHLVEMSGSGERRPRPLCTWPRNRGDLVGAYWFRSQSIPQPARS